MTMFADYIRKPRVKNLKLSSKISPVDTDFSRVTHTIIEIANICNFQCVMCPIDSRGGRNTVTGETAGIMQFDLFKKIIDDVIGHTVTICIQGNGEPMLHPEFFEMIRYIRSQSQEVGIWFNTNGSRMDMQATRVMIENRVTKVYFSLDAASKQVYESIRIGGDWTTVYNNLLQFLKMAQGVVWTGVSFVEQENNMHEKYRFLKEFLPQVDEVIYYTLADKNRIRKKNFEVSVSPRPLCAQLKEQKFITKEGMVMPCCGALIDCALGDISKSSFKNILSGEKFTRLVAHQQKGDFSDCPWCLDCTQWLGGYSVAIKPSLWRKVCELGFSGVHYSYAISPTSEVYTRLKQ